MGREGDRGPHLLLGRAVPGPLLVLRTAAGIRAALGSGHTCPPAIEAAEQSLSLRAGNYARLRGRGPRPGLGWPRAFSAP